MTKLTEDDIAGLNVALNEARLLGIELHPAQRSATVALSLLTLPPVGPPPIDPRFEMHLFPVGRVAAVLASRDGGIERMSINDLEKVVSSFEGRPIYGWDFFGSRDLESRQQLSLDFLLTPDVHAQVLHLFQDDANRKLDVWLWFDDATFRTVDGKDTPISEIIAGATRWWDGVFAGDERTRGTGVEPLKGGNR